MTEYTTTSPAEQKEIPDDYLVVIADDHLDLAEATRQAVETALSRNGKQNSSHIAAGIRELLEIALAGKAGRQADVVLLDDNYSNNGDGRWDINLSDIKAAALKHRVDYSAMAEVDTGSGWREKVVDTLLTHPESTSFALILRTLGYKGKIFIVSGAPPSPGQIMKMVQDIRRAIPVFPDQLPVNGMTMKKPLPSIGVLYGDTVDKHGEWFIKMDQPSLAGSLGQLLVQK